jgi:RNA polymerase sigma-70 factor (ECF subfamily)
VDNKNSTYPADRYLVDKILSGDTNAFDIIIKNTEKLTTQIVFKMIDNAEDRKDLAQEIYLKVYKSLPSFQYQSKLSTWIAQISYNTCFDHLRKKKLVLPGDIHEENEDSEYVLDNLSSSQPIHQNDTAVRINRKELSTILGSELEKLPPLYKTLVTLYHQEELSYEELGQITGLPDGTVKSYLFRARKMLKNNLLLNYKKEDLW